MIDYSCFLNIFLFKGFSTIWILPKILDQEERDRAMLAETAVRHFFDKLNGPIGRTLTKKQLVESMVCLII